MAEKDWIDCGDYWIAIHEQGSDIWLKTRENRITGSRYGAAHCISLYNEKLSTDPTQNIYLNLVILARQVVGIEKKEFADFAIRAMAHGTKMEPVARAWYEKTFNCKVIERGIAVPKWNIWMGSSVDGEIVEQDGQAVAEGIIEIKCPQGRYDELFEHRNRKISGEIFDRYYHSHIKPDHYDQMIGNMAVMNKKFCDYIVYCTATREIYVERVWFNKQYWEEDLYPALQHFIKVHLKPLSKKPPIVPIQYYFKDGGHDW